MTATSSQIGPATKKELPLLLDILAPIFNFSREQGDYYASIVGEKNFRIIRSGSTVIGGCALIPMGQYFGGKSVPMTGVAAVGIAPEHRGRRAAFLLLQSLLRRMHQDGMAISTLYPATLPLYRSLGYQHAGNRFDIRIAAKPLVIRSREPNMDIRRATKKDEPAIRDLYHTRAQRAAGNLDRSEFIWSRIHRPRGSVATGYLVINTQTNKPEGYTFCLQKESFAAPAAHHAPLAMHVSDLVALTPAAGRRLIEFFADHRSMIDQVFLEGGVDDPILKLLPERTYTATLLDHWMTRIVNVGAALTSRGYSSALSGEVHLDIEDDLITENNGCYVLEINRGKPKLSSGGRGDIRIDIRGLAALYTGHLSPHDLQTLGQLSLAPRAKSPQDALTTLATLFAGPSPWLGDMF